MTVLTAALAVVPSWSGRHLSAEKQIDTDEVIAMAPEAGKRQVTTVARQLEIPVTEVLRLAGKPDGNDKSMVVLEDVRAAMAIEAELEASGDTVQPKMTPRVARAARTRTNKNAGRLVLDFRLEPGDRETLREVQAWVDEQREKIEFTLPSNWKPERKNKGSEPGTIKYQTPKGWVDNVPSSDFHQMSTGVIPWQLPEPNPSVMEIRRQADKLRKLSFQAQECRLCREAIDVREGPEFAQIKQLLRGSYVLPYIKHPLRPGQKEMRFRRLHLLCALWEETLADVQLRLSEATSEEIVNELFDAIPRVTEMAQRKMPTATQDDVYGALDKVLVLWAKDEANSNG